MENSQMNSKLTILANQRSKEREYWLNQLAGEWIKSHFPYEYQNQKEPGSTRENPAKTGKTVEFPFTPHLFKEMMRLSRGVDQAIHTIAAAGLVLLLYKYTGSPDIVVGTPVYKQDLDGDFINTVLVLRNQLKPVMTFKELLYQVKHTIDKAIEHQNYPMEILAHQLGRLEPGENDPGFPLFDVAILLKNIHDPEYLRDFHHNVRFSLEKSANSLGGVVEYNSLLYPQETIERMTRHFTRVLQQGLSNVNEAISSLDMLSPDEKRQLLEEFNDTASDFPTGQTVHQWFENQVEKTPGHIAVSSPLDLSDIYNQLESGTPRAHPGEKMGTCCFKQNPYIYRSGLSLPSQHTTLVLLKTHRHNCVIADQQVVKLLAFFNGHLNLKSIYSRVQGLAFSLYILDRSDLLGISFQFNQKPQRFIINEFNDFFGLVKVLAGNDLIELVGIEPAVPLVEHPVLPVFEADSQSTGIDKIDLERLLTKEKQVATAQVLLLGDTPGTPTTGLLYLGAYLQRQGIKTYCQFYDPSPDSTAMKQNLEELLGKIQPRVVAISMKWFLYIARVIDMARMVKEYAAAHSLDITVVVGGNTASYYWENIIKYDCFDVLVRGDGEAPLAKICQGQDISTIPNCVYKKNGEIIENPVTYIQDETNSLEIYLSHLQETLLSNHTSRLGTFFIYTHKGCAMNCLYCGGCNQAQQKTFNRKHLYKRRVQEVRTDITAAKEYASTFQFEFDIPDKNLPGYCRQIWEGIDLSGHFCIFSTLMPPGDALIELVSRTFKYVYWDFDICTPSERHRNQLFSLGLVKPQPSDKDILYFMDRCEKYNNIEVRLNLITGLPYFTSEDIEPGKQLLDKIMNTYSCFSELHWARLHAQPGAPIAKDAAKHHMQSYASVFEDFLKYSKENFDQTSGYSTVEDFNYPYIYFNDDRLNSSVTNFYLETNKKVNQHRIDRQKALIVCDTLTYRELNEKAHRLAGVLRAKGVKPAGIVGLMLERSPDIPVGILGILKTGCAYMPIDPEFPEGRIEYMLKDSNTGVLVSGVSKVSKLSEWDGEILQISDDSPGKSPLERGASSSSLKSLGGGGVCQNPQTVSSPPDLAYVIYTSGTTGQPKGVLLTHENLVNYVHWFTTAAAITKEDKTLLTSSFAFDLGYTSLYTSLLKGGELHILPREIYLLGERLLDYIRQKEITYIKVTPSLFSVIVNSPNFSMKTCETLRLAAIGGEAINVEDIDRAHSLCAHMQIMNHYGPTEATIGCAAAVVNFDQFDEYKNHPVIGTPIYNTNVHILGKDLNILPVRVPGELCISGTCIARGYLNRPELTAGKFDHDLWDLQDYHDE
ncbi:MAG: AMP-binding protein, partial [Candidatus Aminicenantes bacterium]